MSKRYRIARDMGRLIPGYDLLVVNRAGFHFTHPSFLRHGEAAIFETHLSICQVLASVIGECFVVTSEGERVT
jgi:hypothetical protein